MIGVAMPGARYVAVEALTGVPHSTAKNHVVQRGNARHSILQSGPKLRAGPDIEKGACGRGKGRQVTECSGGREVNPP